MIALCCDVPLSAARYLQLSRLYMLFMSAVPKSSLQALLNCKCKLVAADIYVLVALYLHLTRELIIALIAVGHLLQIYVQLAVCIALLFFAAFIAVKVSIIVQVCVIFVEKPIEPQSFKF
jgi:hypothetical protein